MASADSLIAFLVGSDWSDWSDQSEDLFLEKSDWSDGSDLSEQSEESGPV